MTARQPRLTPQLNPFDFVAVAELAHKFLDDVSYELRALYECCEENDRKDLIARLTDRPENPAQSAVRRAIYNAYRMNHNQLPRHGPDLAEFLIVPFEQLCAITRTRLPERKKKS